MGMRQATFTETAEIFQRMSRKRWNYLHAVKKIDQWTRTRQGLFASAEKLKRKTGTQAHIDYMRIAQQIQEISAMISYMEKFRDDCQAEYALADAELTAQVLRVSAASEL